jgi:hypothetical protein
MFIMRGVIGEMRDCIFSADDSGFGCTIRPQKKQTVALLGKDPVHCITYSSRSASAAGIYNFIFSEKISLAYIHCRTQI